LGYTGFNVHESSERLTLGDTMQVRRFSDPADFLKTASPFLVRHEAENNMLLGLANGLMHGEFAQNPPYLAVIERDGEIVMAALRTPPYKLVLSYVEPEDRHEAVYQTLVDAAAAEYNSLPGINGMAEIAPEFVRLWHARTSEHHKLSMSQRIYKLERVIPVADTEGELRRATKDDYELLVRWSMGFQQDIWGKTDEGRVREGLGRFLEANSQIRALYLWEIDGQPVSMVGHAGPTPNGMRVNSVYTPPDLRRRGYASACVAALSQMLLDGGRKFCFLYTDLSNPTSNKIYINIGYEPVIDVSDFDLVTD
jgi:hypothetical protein